MNIQTINIAPEALEIANCYLETSDAKTVAAKLGIPAELVTEYLAKKEVSDYINHVFFEMGWNNRFKLRKLMDNLIDKKLEELDEAEIGSNKDIVDMLETSLRMTLEMQKIELAKAKANAATITNQTNIQINNNPNYNNLIDRLLGSDHAKDI